MADQEPVIVSVSAVTVSPYWGYSPADDPQAGAVTLTFIPEARMNDGTTMCGDLLTYDPRTVTIANGELIGLTMAEVRALAKERGASTGRVYVYDSRTGEKVAG
jgi:hypothetical protein